MKPRRSFLHAWDFRFVTGLVWGAPGFIYLHPMSTSSIILTYLAIALFGMSPILLAVFSGTIAKWLGCTVNESKTYPCVRWGFDFGKLLYTMFVLGWLSLMTMPIAMVLGIVFSVYLLT